MRPRSSRRSPPPARFDDSGCMWRMCVVTQDEDRPWPLAPKLTGCLWGRCNSARWIRLAVRFARGRVLGSILHGASTRCGTGYACVFGVDGMQWCGGKNEGHSVVNQTRLAARFAFFTAPACGLAPDCLRLRPAAPTGALRLANFKCVLSLGSV